MQMRELFLKFKSNNDIRNRFTDKVFFRFFWPVFISNFSLAMGGIADCFFVGMKMKTAGLSAIALGIPVYLFYNVLSYGFSIGGSIHYSTALANGHPNEGNRIFNSILKFLIAVYVLTVAIGIIFLKELVTILGADPANQEVFFMAQNYVRTQLICVPVLYCQGPMFFFLNCDGAPKKAAVALTVSNILDIIFNYIFIVIMEMGPEGSVWSTLVGGIAMIAICLTHILGKRGELRLSLNGFDFSCLGTSIKTGIVTAIQYIYLFITTLIANKLLMKGGGTDAVAVFEVVYNLITFTAVIPDSMEMGLQPMVRSFKTEKSGSAVKRTLKLSICTGTVLAMIETIAIIVLSQPMCRLFGLASEAYTEGTRALIIYSISIIPSVINQCMIYYDQSAEREGTAFMLTSLRTFIFWLGALAVINYSAPQLFFMTYAIADIMTLAVVLVGHKKRSKDWNEENDNSRFEFVITKDTDLGAMVETFQNVCDTWDCRPQQSYYGTLILEEICAAIIQDATTQENVDVSIIGTAIHNEDEIALFIRDDSVKFNPFELKGINDEDTIDIGINIVKKKAKEFFYRRYQGFNNLVVRM